MNGAHIPDQHFPPRSTGTPPLDPRTGGAGASLPQQLASASSDGVIKVWDMRTAASSYGGGSVQQAGTAAGAAAGGAPALAQVRQSASAARQSHA